MAPRRTIATLLALVSVQLVLMTLPPVTMARRIQPLGLSCGMLPTVECAFAVDSAGMRCVLETISGAVDWHVCQTSNIAVGDGSPVGYIETEQCAMWCGVAKMTVGLSTDALDSSDFTSQLCSSECQKNCPNILDLYTNLAAGVGESLKLICTNHQHRGLNIPNRRKEQEVSVPFAGNLVAQESAPAPSSGR